VGTHIKIEKTLPNLSKTFNIKFAMLSYQHDFLEFVIAHNILRFGQFTLKSGRQSPYFFNVGLFNSGKILAQLGYFYAATIHYSGIHFDTLFGPAYKGIPLVVATTIAFDNQYQQDIPFCFNRKETKDHGEGGMIVGTPLQGKVLLVDDVISAGTAIRESVQIIQQHQAQLTGVVIALNRQERGTAGISAIEEIEQTYHVPVLSIIKLDDIIRYLKQQKDQDDKIKAIQDYRDRYGV
jgi:orotate phosphoribosyltransferase